MSIRNDDAFEAAEASRRELERKQCERQKILDLVVSDLCDRDEKGRKTYGESLHSHNGRDALWDAYEEVLDLAMYLRQSIAERGPKP